MSYKIEYTDPVLKKYFPKLSSSVKSQAKKAIDAKPTQDPISYGKPLQHQFYGQRSLRFGDYRIIYTVDNEKKIVTIHAIGHRDKIYN